MELGKASLREENQPQRRMLVKDIVQASKDGSEKCGQNTVVGTGKQDTKMRTWLGREGPDRVRAF